RALAPKPVQLRILPLQVRLKIGQRRLAAEPLGTKPLELGVLRLEMRLKIGQRGLVTDPLGPEPLELGVLHLEMRLKIGHRGLVADPLGTEAIDLGSSGVAFRPEPRELRVLVPQVLSEFRGALRIALEAPAQRRHLLVLHAEVPSQLHDGVRQAIGFALIRPKGLLEAFDLTMAREQTQPHRVGIEPLERSSGPDERGALRKRVVLYVPAPGALALIERRLAL